ncbi:hypothetical protein F4810DRAFT_716751 [Camillea tinctor]|nr:hypothetical protein F4810DRAFT_716751 [Camillea tinctor]
MTQRQDKSAEGIRFQLAILTLAVATVAIPIDSTSLAAAIPTISESIPGSQVDIFWAGVSYLLASTSASAVVVFQAGLTMAMITDLVPLLERARYLALISSIFAIGSIGDRLLEVLVLSLVNGDGYTGLSFISVVLFLKLNRREASVATKLREIDWPGLGLFAASVTALLVPITWGGIQFPWGSWNTIVPIVLGLAGIVGFTLYEEYATKPPFLPLYIFRNYSTSIIFVGSFINGVLLYVQVYYMPEYFQAVKLYSPLIAGVAALPGSLTAIPCAAFTGVMVDKTGHYRWAVWTGWTLATFGFGIMCLLSVDTSIPV